MAQPSSREGLIDYAKRQLGFPVLEINVADEQFQDLLDDAIQIYQERHYDGIARMYLKYKITQDDIDREQEEETPPLELQLPPQHQLLDYQQLLILKRIIIIFKCLHL